MRPVNLRDHPGRPLGRPLRVAVAGAGARGSAYARLVAEHGAEVVAVAEPREAARSAVAQAHGIPRAAQFATWEAMLGAGRLADAVVVAVQDREHLAAATAAARAGYDILLEKPIAPTEAQCRTVVTECDRAGVWLGVCHVLRYAPYSRLVRSLIDAGEIGEVVSVEHLEPVGHWHFAHSYVRGSWRREELSGPVLLTKSSHDLDWLGHVVGRPARRVSSFGALTHFRAEEAPEGSGERCLECAVEPSCPWSAVRTYRRGLEPDSREEYFTRVVAPEGTADALEDALRHGPYGRCVYRCDNDVLDHQVVAVEYDGGATATFTLSAFTPMGHRRTRVFGTGGQLRTDGERVEVHDFLTGRTRVYELAGASGASAGEGHAGGDAALAAAFVDTLTLGDAALFPSDGRTSLATHAVVFAAERARLSGTVVELGDEAGAPVESR